MLLPLHVPLSTTVNAGTVVGGQAGTDPILERSVEGIAIVTDIAAGKAIAAK